MCFVARDVWTNILMKSYTQFFVYALINFSFRMLKLMLPACRPAVVKVARVA